MADYTGKKCTVCDRSFSRDDDIVVCPDCGTPYHRECYLEKGECINYELHESGGSWSEEQQSDRTEFSTDDAIKCPRCGTENPPKTLFCESCGLPLGMKTSGAQQGFNDVNGQNMNAGPMGMGPMGMGPMGMGPMGMPFVQTQKVTPDTDFDGNTAGEYASYVGQNRLYFLAQFLKFSKTKSKSSFSFVGFLFPEYYFFYRKMYGKGILIFLLTLLISIPSMIITFNVDYIDKVFGSAELFTPLLNDVNLKSELLNRLYDICWVGSWVLQIVCGIFVNFWYYKQAKKTVEKAKEKAQDDKNEATRIITEKGGTSVGAMILSICLHAALTVAVLLAVKYRSTVLGWF